MVPRIWYFFVPRALRKAAKTKPRVKQVHKGARAHVVCFRYLSLHCVLFFWGARPLDFETLVTKGASIFSACSGGRDEQYFLSKACCYKHRFESTRAHVLSPWPLWTVRHPATRETCLILSALEATGATKPCYIISCTPCGPEAGDKQEMFGSEP